MPTATTVAVTHPQTAIRTGALPWCKRPNHRDTMEVLVRDHYEYYCCRKAYITGVINLVLVRTRLGPNVKTCISKRSTSKGFIPIKQTSPENYNRCGGFFRARNPSSEEKSTPSPNPVDARLIHIFTRNTPYVQTYRSY